MYHDVSLVLKYFPELTGSQIDQFTALKVLYEDWNARINVISRKDIGSLYERHVLHSLGIARIVAFHPHTKIMDAGTGGGFPGIPLAILFPECRFHLVDSIAKKIKVVTDICQQLNLTNVTAENARIEKTRGKYHFVVSRAVTQLPLFRKWTGARFERVSVHADFPNGILYLKGGDLSAELSGIKDARIYDLSHCFSEPFFEGKKVVFIPFR